MCGKASCLRANRQGPGAYFCGRRGSPARGAAAKGPPGIETALKIGASIAEAVAALHKERLIHGNLNPTTIWLNDESGDVLISDFGCARHLSEDTPQEVPPCDDLLDVRYMSPEQTGRVQNTVDQRTDIYSLGIILFRLLTGKVPFDDADPLHIIDGHVARQPTFPAEFRPLPVPCQGGIKGAGEGRRGPLPERQRASRRPARMSRAMAFTGAIEAFEPGRYDAKGVLRVSRRLYGREHDTAVLLEKARPAQGGRPAMLLVTGAPGVGKSILWPAGGLCPHRERALCDGQVRPVQAQRTLSGSDPGLPTTHRSTAQWEQG